MRRLPAVALLAFLIGCSNAPVAGFLDTVAPARGGGGRDIPEPPKGKDTGLPSPFVPDVGPGGGPAPTPPPGGGGSLPPPPKGTAPQPELDAPKG